MATKINDLPDSTRLIQAFGPISLTDESIESDAVDLIDGDGPAFAILSIGEVTLTATLGATLETSPNTHTWEPVENGTLATEDATSFSLRAIAFQRKYRYVRAVISVSNNGQPTPLAILIGQGRKQI